MVDEPRVRTPYARTFFPGVSKQDGAHVLTVGETSILMNHNFVVPAKLNARKVTVMTVRADGTPARFVHVWCSALGYTPWAHVLTDRSGQVIFDVLDGLAYQIGGAAASNYEIPALRRYSAEPVRVGPGNNMRVRLVLSIAPSAGAQ